MRSQMRIHAPWGRLRGPRQLSEREWCRLSKDDRTAVRRAQPCFLSETCSICKVAWVASARAAIDVPMPCLRRSSTADVVFRQWIIACKNFVTSMNLAPS
jgi:hypothetical protein